MATGTTGIGFGPTNLTIDPSASAQRIIAADGVTLPTTVPYTAATLLSAINVTGTAANVLTATAFGGGYGIGFYRVQQSGNSGSAAFAGSIDGTNWNIITGLTGMGVNQTGTGQWSGYYPYIAGVVVWESGGAITGTTTLTLGMT